LRTFKSVPVVSNLNSLYKRLGTGRGLRKRSLGDIVLASPRVFDLNFHL